MIQRSSGPKHRRVNIVESAYHERLTLATQHIVTRSGYVLNTEVEPRLAHALSMAKTV
jgi:hypothetical protein